MYTPPGFAPLTPYFFVSKAEKFLAFLSHAFDAKPGLVTRREDGTIANAQVEISQQRFMVSEATPAFPAMPGSYYLYVDNADTVTQKALNAGGDLIMPVQDMDYGDRQSGVKDPHGNLWWISQRLIETSYE